MKVLIVAPDAPPYKGGISRITSILRDGLTHLGHEVSIVSPKFRVGELKFSTIPFGKYSEFDIIHVHGPTPFLSDLMLLLHSKRRIVYTHHAQISYGSEIVAGAYRSLHKILAMKAKALIVHSFDYANLFSAHKNVVVIRPPCAFGNLAGDFNIYSKSLPFTVLFVGQLRPFKGVSLLIKAASMVRDVHFIIVGNGYLKPKLLRLADKLNLENVMFYSNVSDDELVSFYKKAHVVCLPSVNTTEAWGLVLTEGALFGCVPLASNLIGVRENVKLLGGILFRPRSYIDLAKKIRTLSENMNLWEKLSQKCCKAASKYTKVYSPDYYVRKHIEVFSMII